MDYFQKKNDLKKRHLKFVWFQPNKQKIRHICSKFFDEKLRQQYICLFLRVYFYVSKLFLNRDGNVDETFFWSLYPGYIRGRFTRVALLL